MGVVYFSMDFVSSIDSDSFERLRDDHMYLMHWHMYIHTALGKE